MSAYTLSILVLIAFNVILAYAAYLPLAAGQLNLGIAGFMAVGAYGSAYLTNEYGWAFVPAALVGACASAVVAALVGFPVMRTKGIYLALATFALGEVISAIFLNLEVVGAAAGYPVMTYVGSAWVLGAAALVVGAVYLLSRTRFALVLTAIKNDSTVSGLFGANVKVYQVAAFAIGAGLAGLGGALYAHYYSFIEAQHFNVLLSVNTVLYVLLGGAQTVWGPLVGAIIFAVLPELLRVSDEWRFALFAAFIVAFIALRPHGLVSARFLRRLSLAVRGGGAA